jgi:hypothetical protein
MRLPIIIAVLAVALTSQAADKIKVLIIDGQNNHKWAITSPIMKSQLEATGIFTVDVSTSPEKKNPKATPEDQANLKAQWDS